MPVYITTRGKAVSAEVYEVAKIIASDAEGADAWSDYVELALRILDKLKKMRTGSGAQG